MDGFQCRHKGTPRNRGDGPDNPGQGGKHGGIGAAPGGRGNAEQKVELRQTHTRPERPGEQVQ